EPASDAGSYSSKALRKAGLKAVFPSGYGIGRSHPPVEGRAIGVADAVASENIQGAADGEIQASCAFAGEAVQIRNVARTSGIGDRQWGDSGQQIHQFPIH